MVGGETPESFETCDSLSLGITPLYLSSVFEDDFALIPLLTVFDSSLGEGVVLSTGEGEGVVWGETSESFVTCVSLSLGITSLSFVEGKRDVSVVLIPCPTLPTMLCFYEWLEGTHSCLQWFHIVNDKIFQIHHLPDLVLKLI